MDPEIFFLSTATLGWELSVWRLVATFIISLSSGYITHFMMHKGMLDEKVLRNNKVIIPENIWKVIWAKTIEGVNGVYAFKKKPR